MRRSKIHRGDGGSNLRARAALRAVALLIAFWAAGPAAAAGLPAASQAEIRQLLDALERSGCEFFRNGRWYEAAEARRHLDRKYRYLLDRGLVGSAEDFIARAATESSLSGRPYQVRCGAASPVPSAEWLGGALQHLRSEE